MDKRDKDEAGRGLGELSVAFGLGGLATLTLGILLVSPTLMLTGLLLAAPALILMLVYMLILFIVGLG